MSDPLFICPAPTAITAIPSQACPERLPQIQRFAFQRKQAIPSFTTTGVGDIKLQASWTPLLAASDSTKIVLTPRIAGIVIPPGEILSQGGNDNSTLDGVPEVLGRGAVTLTAALKDANAAVRTAIRKLFSESGGGYGTNLWMYMIGADGTIIGNADASGIDVYNVIVGDIGSEGFARPTLANVSMGLPPGWSDTMALFTPTAPFKPLNL